jgi:molybdopterin molybdotransferase
LIPLEEAQEIVLSNTPRLPIEEVDFQEAPGRVLAEDIASDIDLPPFPRSMMDGYALRSEDARATPTRLDVVGVIPAGTFPPFRIESGQAAQIMTGAPVPEGADAVQIVEETRVVGDQVEILEPVQPDQYVVARGSEVKIGDVVLKKGTHLDPAAVAVAATAGRVRMKVGRKPRVAVIATGDELVPPSEKPGPGQIRNSNGFSLAAQARMVGAQVTYLGVAADDTESLEELIRNGLTYDVLLLSGGVSMGRLDLVEEVVGTFGVKILIEKVAVKPGKPTVFGVAPKGNIVFGLPGNPVSTMVTFELFVRPAMAKMEGSGKPWRPYLQAVLTGPLSSRGPRRAFLPGWLEPSGEGKLPAAHPITSRGSGDIVAFSKANALLVLPENLDRLEAGHGVQVYPLDSFLFKEDRWQEERKS